MQLYDTLRNIIEGQGSRITSVEFIKKDGSYRRMLVQSAATKFHLAGDLAEESHARGAETRRARHPNLLNIWDMEKAAIRSINMDTIITITGSGKVLYFRHPEEVLDVKAN